MGHDHPVGTACGNCGAPLVGLFCHVCGQKAVGTEVRLHDLFHEAFHELAHVDGKILQTLRILITKPGMLTAEFLSGRRARYLSPIRLYLTCSVLFFGLAAIAPDVTRSVIRVSYTPSPGEAPLSAEAEQRLRDAASARMGRAILHDFPRVMFALMPAFGLLTWMFYRKARPFYVAHLYYSIHFHAFVFLALTLTIPLFLLGGRAGPQTARLVLFAILAYHYVSLRRVFGGSRLQTAWKGTLLWIIYVAVVIATMIVIGLQSVKGLKPDAPHEALLREQSKSPW
jgi:hypothetical protein